MKRNGTCITLAVAAVLALFIFAGAGHTAPLLTYTIEDTGSTAYWGGTVQRAGSNYGDVIGVPEFNVDQMVASFDGATFTITIKGDYFNKGDYTVWGPGDLYISTSGWKVNSPADHAQLDTFKATEGWDYVVTGGYKEAGGSWLVNPGVYKLDFDKIAWTNTTNPNHPGNWIYRADQAWRGGYGDAANNNASYSWFKDQSGKYVGQFVFSGAGVGWAPGVDPGVHWTMQCGNDVVEGKIPDPPTVPEPGSLLLLGLGLVGLTGLKRKLAK